MTSFIQVSGAILIAVILGLTLRQQGKDIALLISIAVCCMALAAAMSYLQPVIDFIQRLQELSGISSAMLRILLKAVGIGLLAQMTAAICADAGNSALAKTIHMMASAVILWLSIPLMESFLDIVQQIMGEV